MRLLTAVIVFFTYLFLISPQPAEARNYLVPGRNPQSKAIKNAGSETRALQIAQAKGMRVFQLEEDTYLGTYGAAWELAQGWMPAGTWMGELNGKIYVIGYTDQYGVWRGCGNLTDLIPPPPPPPPPTAEVPPCPETPPSPPTVYTTPPPPAYMRQQTAGVTTPFVNPGSVGVSVSHRPEAANIDIDNTNINKNRNTNINENDNTLINAPITQVNVQVPVAIGIGLGTR